MIFRTLLLLFTSCLCFNTYAIRLRIINNTARSVNLGNPDPLYSGSIMPGEEALVTLSTESASATLKDGHHIYLPRPVIKLLILSEKNHSFSPGPEISILKHVTKLRIEDLRPQPANLDPACPLLETITTGSGSGPRYLKSIDLANETTIHAITLRTLIGTINNRVLTMIVPHLEGGVVCRPGISDYGSWPIEENGTPHFES